MEADEGRSVQLVRLIISRFDCIGQCCVEQRDEKRTNRGGF
jgi:hypothetical protein